MTKKLPDLPSELLTVTLADLRKCMADPRYQIRMGVWHEPRTSSGHCLVCAAGAVMAQSLHKNIELWAAPCEYDDGTSRKLEAINCFRTGYIVNAVAIMGLEVPEGLKDDHSMMPFRTNPDAWFGYMERMIDYLKEFGL